MELHGKQIVLIQRAGKFLTVFSDTCHVFTALWLNIIAVHKIESTFVLYAAPQRMNPALPDAVPAHVRNLQSLPPGITQFAVTAKAAHFALQQAETFNMA